MLECHVRKRKKKPEESGDSDPPRDESVREEKKKKRVVCVCGGGKVCDVCAQSKLRADSHIPSRKEEKERTSTKYQREYEWLKKKKSDIQIFLSSIQSRRVHGEATRWFVLVLQPQRRSVCVCVCVLPASLLTVSVVAYSM